METAKGLTIVNAYYFIGSEKKSYNLEIKDFSKIMLQIDFLTKSEVKELFLNDRDKKQTELVCSILSSNGIATRFNKAMDLITRLNNQLSKLNKIDNENVKVATNGIAYHIEKIKTACNNIETAITILNTALNGLLVVKLSVSIGKEKLVQLQVTDNEIKSLGSEPKED